MKSFDYVITDPVGIHARPAGILVKEVKNYKDSVITFAVKKHNALTGITVIVLKLILVVRYEAVIIKRSAFQGDKIIVTEFDDVSDIATAQTVLGWFSVKVYV